MVSFDRLVQMAGASEHLWDAAALVCLDKGPLHYRELGPNLTELSGAPPDDGAVARSVRRLRDSGLIEVIASAGAPPGPYALTDAGRARLAEIRAAADADSNPAEGRSRIGTSGQDSDGATGSMMPSRDRRPAGFLISPWGSRHDAEEVESLQANRPVIDTSVPHPARRYNYWLGGKDHFAADRESARQLEQIQPTARMGALENRGFQRRVVDVLARSGIRQFLDIGTGIPAPDNTHEVAQAIDPAARVVYVDNDPLVLTHARALLNSGPEGRTAYIDADLRTPDKILEDPELQATLDLSQPVGLLLIAVLHFVADDALAYDVVNRLVSALPPGSYVAITHVTLDYLPPDKVAATNAAIASGKHGDLRFRSREEFTRFFDGLDVLQPGLVPVAEWRPTKAADELPAPADIGIWAGAAKVS